MCGPGVPVGCKRAGKRQTWMPIRSHWCVALGCLLAAGWSCEGFRAGKRQKLLMWLDGCKIGLTVESEEGEVPHLRWSQAPPLPWPRPGSADMYIIYYILYIYIYTYIHTKYIIYIRYIYIYTYISYIPLYHCFFVGDLPFFLWDFSTGTWSQLIPSSPLNIGKWNDQSDQSPGTTKEKGCGMLRLADVRQTLLSASKLTGA